MRSSSSFPKKNVDRGLPLISTAMLIRIPELAIPAWEQGLTLVVLI